MHLALIAGLQRLLTDSTPDGLREHNGEVGLMARRGHTLPCGFMMGAREGGAGPSGGHAGAGGPMPPAQAVPAATGKHGLGRGSLVVP